MTRTYDVGGVALPRPFHIQRFGHIGLSQPDLEGATRFWVEELGFRVTDALQPPGAPRAFGYFTTYGADHHALVNIDAMLDAGPHLERGVTVNQISFQVGTLAEVVEANAYFAEHGVETWRYGRDFPGSNWAVYAFDPDGFRVELFYGMEQIGWDRRSKPPQLYQSLDYTAQIPERAEITEILQAEIATGPLPDGHRGGESLPFSHEVGGVLLPRPFAINRMGPVHLFVDDVERSEAFYTRHFGLIRSEEVVWQGHRAVFLRSGSDHHVIGLLPFALREILGFDVRSRLASFGIELGSYRQLSDAVSWLKARGLQVRTDVPQALRPGIDYAAFVTDPSGHTAMLFCGIEQIGWDGAVRAVDQRRAVEDPWPARLNPISDTYAGLNRQGPMA